MQNQELKRYTHNIQFVVVLRGNHFPKKRIASNHPQRCRQPVDRRCNRTLDSRHQQYPARDVECRKCHHIGHFQVVCHTRSVQEVVCRNDEASKGDTFLFVCSVDCDADDGDDWIVNLNVSGTSVRVKIDTGADTTIINRQTYQGINKTPN